MAGYRVPIPLPIKITFLSGPTNKSTTASRRSRPERSSRVERYPEITFPRGGKIVPTTLRRLSSKCCTLNDVIPQMHSRCNYRCTDLGPNTIPGRVPNYRRWRHRRQASPPSSPTSSPEPPTRPSSPPPRPLLAPSSPLHSPRSRRPVRRSHGFHGNNDVILFAPGYAADFTREGQYAPRARHAGGTGRSKQSTVGRLLNAFSSFPLED